MYSFRKKRSLFHESPKPFIEKKNEHEIVFLLEGDTKDPLFSCISRALASLPSFDQDKMIEKIEKIIGVNPRTFPGRQRGLDTATLRLVVACEIFTKSKTKKYMKQISLWKTSGAFMDDVSDCMKLGSFVCNSTLYKGDCFAIEVLESVLGINFTVYNEKSRSILRTGTWGNDAWSSVIVLRKNNIWAQIVSGTKAVWAGSDAWKQKLKMYVDKNTSDGL